MTKAEWNIWSKLRGNQLGVKIRRQVPCGRYILDFYCPKAKLDIELDGSQHYTEEGMRKDEKRDGYLREQGIKVLRFSDADSLRDPNGVAEAIYEVIEQRLMETETPSYPSPERGRDGVPSPLRRGLG
jgi:very-short-patch-repair endonuclease